MFTQDAPDEETIGPYYQSPDYVSHTNTQQGLVNNIYHRVRKITLASKQKLVEEYCQKSRGSLLDIGAGIGAFAAHLKMAGWTVTGLEPDNQTRKRANEIYAIELLPSEVLYEMKDDSFDAITMWHVLEHVHDLHGYLSKIRSALKPGGKIFIAVPNHQSGDAAYYKENWAAFDVPRHLYHFNPKAMKMVLGLNNLKLIDTKPMWFDSYYVSLLSEKYKSGKQSLIGGALRGLSSNLQALANKKRSSSLIYIVGK